MLPIKLPTSEFSTKCNPIYHEQATYKICWTLFSTLAHMGTERMKSDWKTMWTENI